MPRANLRVCPSSPLLPSSLLFSAPYSTLPQHDAMPYTGKSNLATVSEHDARARREGNARFAGEDGGAKLPGKRRRMGVPLAFSLWGASLFDADENKKTHMFTRTHAHTNVALATITRCFEEVR